MRKSYLFNILFIKFTPPPIIFKKYALFLFAFLIFACDQDVAKSDNSQPTKEKILLDKAEEFNKAGDYLNAGDAFSKAGEHDKAAVAFNKVAVAFNIEDDLTNAAEAFINADKMKKLANSL